MGFPSETGPSFGNQGLGFPSMEEGVGSVHEVLPTANDLAARIISLDERIAYGPPSKRSKVTRERDDLFDQWAANYPNHLAVIPRVDMIPASNDHIEPVLNRPARKSELARRARQLLVAGTIAVSAATVGAQAFEARADGPLPFQPKLTGSIEADTEIDFIQKENGVYAAMPMQLKKSGPETLTWTRFTATGGDIVNGWVKGLEQFKAKITGTLAQCADMIVWTNRSSFSDSEKQSSARRMNTNASPVLVSVQPTVTVNGKIERNYCAVNNPDLLRVKSTRTPPAVVPPPASTGQNNEDENRKNTLFGGALIVSALGLVSGALLLIRRRNQMGAGRTSMVQGAPIDYSHRLKRSIAAPTTERMDSAEEKAVAEEVTGMVVSRIGDYRTNGEECAAYMGDVYQEIRDRRARSHRTHGTPQAKPQGR